MSLQSLIDTGTKLWLDSAAPEEVKKNRRRGITGATSNPIIIAEIVESGAFDEAVGALLERNLDDSAIAWQLTDRIVCAAQEVFRPVWEKTRGDDGYVSFELDPLLEDADHPVPHAQRVEQYQALGRRWSKGHENRMIKVPATAAGLEALEDLAAAGVTINVTLMFTQRQYQAARDAIWRGAQRRKDGLERFKSVYSIFISRIDVYTDKHLTDLSDDAQGAVGLLVAKQVWRENEAFWADKKLPLRQEIIFASTGKKLDWQSEDYYPAALAGSDIQTNPPKTMDAIEELDKQYPRQVDRLPAPSVIDEIRAKVDMGKLEEALMREGAAKFAKPMHALLELIAQKRGQLATNR